MIWLRLRLSQGPDNIGARKAHRFAPLYCSSLLCPASGALVCSDHLLLSLSVFAAGSTTEDSTVSTWTEMDQTYSEPSGSESFEGLDKEPKREQSSENVDAEVPRPSTPSHV
jgi:hypothetical protein